MVDLYSIRFCSAVALKILNVLRKAGRCDMERGNISYLMNQLNLLACSSMTHSSNHEQKGSDTLGVAKYFGFSFKYVLLRLMLSSGQ